MDQGAINVSTELDSERQKQAKKYARINRRLMVLDLIISGVFLLAWLVFGWSEALKIWLLRFTTNDLLLLLLYVVVIGGIMFLINFPLSYYQGYTLPHRFDLSTEKISGWITDQVKGILLGGAIGIFVLEIIYAILRAYPALWWLWAAGIMLVFNVILANIDYAHIQ
jgi:STE24 endopeptidase